MFEYDRLALDVAQQFVTTPQQQLFLILNNNNRAEEETDEFELCKLCFEDDDDDEANLFSDDDSGVDNNNHTKQTKEMDKKSENHDDGIGSDNGSVINGGVSKKTAEQKESESEAAAAAAAAAAAVDDGFSPNEIAQFAQLLSSPKKAPPQRYQCHICYQTGHYISDCPMRFNSPYEELTPYQGRKKCYGEFQCQLCKRKWISRNSVANEAQSCIKCHVPVFPHKQLPVDKAIALGLVRSQRVTPTKVTPIGHGRPASNHHNGNGGISGIYSSHKTPFRDGEKSGGGTAFSFGSSAFSFGSNSSGSDVFGGVGFSSSMTTSAAANPWAFPSSATSPSPSLSSSNASSSETPSLFASCGGGNVVGGADTFGGMFDPMLKC